MCGLPVLPTSSFLRTKTVTTNQTANLRLFLMDLITIRCDTTSSMVSGGGQMAGYMAGMASLARDQKWGLPEHQQPSEPIFNAEFGDITLPAKYLMSFATAQPIPGGMTGMKMGSYFLLIPSSDTSGMWCQEHVTSVCMASITTSTSMNSSSKLLTIITSISARKSGVI